MRAIKQRVLWVVTYAALLPLLLWPALYNGQPLFSTDTTAYIRGFDAGVVWLSGRTSAWTTWAAEPSGRHESEGATPDASKSFQSSTFIITGRSVTYGALLYLGELIGGLWGSVLIQAALALAAITLTLRHLNLFTWTKLVIVTSTLGLVSSLPFFASFLLPDVFAGLSLLAAGNLLAPGNLLKHWERVFWISILATAAVFHPSHLGIIAVLPAAALMAYFYNSKISKSGVAALVLATCIGFASEVGFALILDKLRGVQVTRPPVIMARMIADGPGAAYLREKCPEAGFKVCDYVGRLGSNSDAFLWDTSPATGVYSPSSQGRRRELANEQYRFALAVLAYDPVGQVAASLNDAFDQIKLVGLSDFVQAAHEAYPKLPPEYSKALSETPIWRKEFPIAFFSSLTITAALLSLVYAGATLIKFWRVISAQAKFLCLTVMLGQFSNAFICGALSGPHERYQARLTWLFPFIALILYYEVQGSRATRLQNGPPI